MNRLIRLLGAAVAILISLSGTPVIAAELTIQLINNTERPLSLKLFSRAESHQEWPSRTKFYTIRPDDAVQQLKISCEEGEQICWGAWMKVEEVSGEVDSRGKRDVRTMKITYGAGERGIRPCTRCCNVCTDGSLTPVVKLRDGDKAAR